MKDRMLVTSTIVRSTVRRLLDCTKKVEDMGTINVLENCGNRQEAKMYQKSLEEMTAEKECSVSLLTISLVRSITCFSVKPVFIAVLCKGTPF